MRGRTRKCPFESPPNGCHDAILRMNTPHPSTLLTLSSLGEGEDARSAPNFFNLQKNIRTSDEVRMLFYFLLQIVEQVAVKKRSQRDVQSVTDFFDGGNRGVVAAGIDDVVDGRLCDAAHQAEPVDGDAPLGA